MKRVKLILLITPLIMATQCEDDFTCGFEDFDGFAITVENTQSTYDIGESIWLNAEASSMLEDGCNGNNLEVVTDAELFRDSLFILQLTQNGNGEINAEVVETNTTFSMGSALDLNFCPGATWIEPVLSEDALSYNYRLGLDFSNPGDYCVVLGRHGLTSFNDSDNVNLEIYESYNNGENTVKFIHCDDIYTRNLDSGVYFFSIL